VYETNCPTDMRNHRERMHGIGSSDPAAPRRGGRVVIIRILPAGREEGGELRASGLAQARRAASLRHDERRGFAVSITATKRMEAGMW
jgi:hypothetical protein